MKDKTGRVASNRVVGQLEGHSYSVSTHTKNTHITRQQWLVDGYDVLATMCPCLDPER